MTIYFSNLIIIVFVDLPSLPGVMNGAVGYVFFTIILLLQFGVFVFAYICTTSDPTDPVIYLERDYEARG